jgi:hypothetical protein
VEAFEQFVAVAMQAEGLVVSSSVKFRVARQVKKVARVEVQEHGYEVDLVGARSDRLVLATVKSFFGSKGVQAREVAGVGIGAGGYRLLNDPVIREGVIAKAADRYGYAIPQVQLRLYVGKFARGDEEVVRSWCAEQGIGLYSAADVVKVVMDRAGHGEYVDDASIVALKVLHEAGVITLPKPQKKATP